MVKKLFKYEIISYLRMLLPFGIILIAAACLSRLVELFRTDHWSFQILSKSTTAMLWIAGVALLTATSVKAVTRFYKNLYTAEGYLSFTLPVTEAQHLWVKLLTAMMFEGIALFCCFVSFLIATAGEVGAEIFKASDYIIDEAAAEVDAHIYFYILEFVLLFISALASTLLIYYSCISLGQLAKKNRVAAAFGVYGIYYVIMQILSTVLIVTVPFVLSDIGQEMLDFIEKNILTLIHCFFATVIVISLAVSTGLFFLNRYIMRRKLNLE